MGRALRALFEITLFSSYYTSKLHAANGYRVLHRSFLILVMNMYNRIIIYLELKTSLPMQEGSWPSVLFETGGQLSYE